jgi:hypothetical protein
MNNLRSIPTDPALPIDDPLSKIISGFAVHMLHSNMLHPPQTYLGNKFQYRSADGSDNVCSSEAQSSSDKILIKIH